jgi:dCTP deaminase
MIVNGTTLLAAAPIREMVHGKVRENGVSWGLSEVGYDIRLKQDIWFWPKTGTMDDCEISISAEGDGNASTYVEGNFVLASAIEEFMMPNDLCGIVHDKSTWARHGLSVFNTVIEPGWKGFLTLELVFNGRKELHIPAGSGIAQVIFHKVTCPAEYAGKYQNQPDRPTEPIRT